MLIKSAINLLTTNYQESRKNTRGINHPLRSWRIERIYLRKAQIKKIPRVLSRGRLVTDFVFEFLKLRDG
jgi:hypothetical protein